MKKHDFPIISFNLEALSSPVRPSCGTCDILCFRSGKAEISFSNAEARTYRSRDILFLYPRQEVLLKPTESCHVLHLRLSPAFLEEYLDPDSVIFCDSVLEPNRSYLSLRLLLEHIAQQYNNEISFSAPAVYSSLFELLDLLLKKYSLKLPVVPEYKNEKQKERIMEIQDYIHSHYNQPVTLSDLAGTLHLSPQYVSKIMQDCFHIRFSEYVNLLRLRHAEHDLCYSDSAVTDIALQNGFSSITTFNKHFRDIYGLSPKKYRTEHQIRLMERTEDIPANIRNVYLHMDTPSEERIVSVDTGCFTDFSENLFRLMNVGFAKNLLLDYVQNQITRACRDLHLKYIRLESLVSNAMIPRLAEENDYYFSAVEGVLDFLQKKHLIPFIELGKNSYHYLQENSQSRRGYSTNLKFHRLLEAFLQFVTTHYNAEWYGQWMFELWKPPAEPLSDWISGYQTIRDIIRHYIPSAAFGGPGYNTGRPVSELTDCLESLSAGHMIPDFISVHCFSIQRLEINGQQETVHLLEPDILKTQQDWILRQIRRTLGGSCPLYITELNSSLIPGTFFNESCYQAAFLCHTLLGLHETADMIGYWMLGDTLTSLKNPASWQISGIGLITGNGIPTPAYHACRLLDMLGGHLLEQGDNYCITETEENHFQILAWHYAPFLPAYSVEGEKPSLKNVYHCFRDLPALQMTFHLQHIEIGTYRVKRYLLDRFHGSFLDIQLGELMNSDLDEETFLYKTLSPHPQEMAYLASACIPEERTIYVRAEDTLTVHSPVYAHNLCLWDIIKEF